MPKQLRRPVNSDVRFSMHSNVATRLLAAMLLISWGAPLTSAQSATASRSYRLGTVGYLEMSVPSSWQDNSKTMDKPQAVTLAYRLPSRTDFYMKVTAVWIRPEARASREGGWLKRAVEKIARRSGGSEKRQAALTQISSPGGSGYYFQAPGYFPYPIGDFTYKTEGILELGEVTFIFSTYSNTKDLPEIADALRVVESARFVAAKT